MNRLFPRRRRRKRLTAAQIAARTGDDCWKHDNRALQQSGKPYDLEEIGDQTVDACWVLLGQARHRVSAADYEFILQTLLFEIIDNIHHRQGIVPWPEG